MIKYNIYIIKLLNWLVVTNTETEANQAENEDESGRSELVEWSDISADDTASPDAEKDDVQSSTDTQQPAATAEPATKSESEATAAPNTTLDEQSRSTPDTAVTNDEVDAMDVNQLLGNVLKGITAPNTGCRQCGSDLIHQQHRV